MQSIKQLYKIGRGPSSSHTMGPYFACKMIKERYPQARKAFITLYNSLALTGEGHLTFSVIKNTLAPIPVEFATSIKMDHHPNFMEIEIHLDDDVKRFGVTSIGGGDIIINDEKKEIINIYPHKKFSEIKEYCEGNNLTLYEYVKMVEGKYIDDFLLQVWQQMQKTIKNGLSKEGILPGKLEVKRKAKELLTKQMENEPESITEHRLVSAYAYATSEENADGGIIVTAPTCGSCGVLPAVLYYMQGKRRLPDQKIIEALAIAGLIGNIIKENATISGAVGGCQAEVGSACAMAAAAHASLFDATIDQIEYAAEVAIEHHLGLTCDPISGYVQIPCIERNAVAAIRAINASGISYFLSGSRKISFDMIVQTMYKTGLDMHPKYKETAEAGMAFFYHQKQKVE
ncbi:MAG TPA: L-serine ammonia-lyase, iron-sulfur-dependent, subunit alpha [Bacilli bacterium]